MKSFSRSLVVMAVAAGLALPAMAAAAPQGGVSLNHAHGKAALQSAAPADSHQTVMARMAKLDERINTLTADMNMFVGDMKVQTMASLLTAMVERQALMREQMMSMMQAAPKPAPFDDEPGAMCAPDPTR